MTVGYVVANARGGPTITVVAPEPHIVLSPHEAEQFAQNLMDASDSAEFQWPTPTRRETIRRSVVGQGRTHGNRVEIARYLLDCLKSVDPDVAGDLEQRILEAFRCIIHLGQDLEIQDPTALWATAQSEVYRETIRYEIMQGLLDDAL